MHLIEVFYRQSLHCSTPTPHLVLKNITNSKSFLSLRTKMCSLVLLLILHSWKSLRSLLWLLFLLEEDQMRGVHANLDLMWHIVKWASIMHVPSGWGCASPNASYFSLLLSHDSFCRKWREEKQHLTAERLTDRQGQGKDKENKLMRTYCSPVCGITDCIYHCSTHAWHTEQILLQPKRGTA